MKTRRAKSRRLPSWVYLSKRPAFAGLLAAIALVALSTGLRVCLGPYLRQLLFFTYLPAVILAGWFGGFWPGVLATLLSAVCVDYFLIGQLTFSLRVIDLIRISFFIGCGFLISALNGTLHFLLRNENAAREEYEVTLASIGDAVIVTDASGRITFLNPVASELTGWAAAEAIGQPLSLVFHIINEETRLSIPNPTIEVFKHARRVVPAHQALLVSQAGTETPIEDRAAPVKGPNGELVGAVLVFYDITDRRKAEAELGQSQKTFSELVERAPFGIYIVDAQLRIVQMNRGSQEGAFRNVRPVIGRDFAEAMRILWPEAVAVEIMAALRRTLETGEPFYSPRFIHARQDIPSREAYEWELHRMKLPNGAYGVICYYFDSTKLRQTEAALQQAQDALQLHATTLEKTVTERTGELRAHIAQLEEFSYAVSHDLRSPLRAMQGYATAVLEDYGEALDATGKGYLERVIKAAHRMDLLTRDVLAYSKLSRASVPLQPLHLEELVRDILDQYPNVRASHAEVIVHSPLLDVLGNESLLTQAIGNLMANAVKFVAAGRNPKVELRTERRPGERVRFLVQDNGIGIKPEYQARLFGLFERIDPQSHYEGTGIGLAIVRKAAERLGGTVGMESDGENGSTFWIELPAVRAAAEHK